MGFGRFFEITSGESRIRTHGPVTVNSFQDCRIRPLCHFSLAEAVGFEPTDLLQPTVFKTAAFDHSATPPWGPIPSFHITRTNIIFCRVG